jgi:hypothetical protein
MWDCSNAHTYLLLSLFMLYDPGLDNQIIPIQTLTSSSAVVSKVLHLPYLPTYYRMD